VDYKLVISFAPFLILKFMENSTERFGYDDAARARDLLVSDLQGHMEWNRLR
jgi:hypothetical protein